MPQMQIFVSHSHEDNDFCAAVVNTLSNKLTDTWFDQYNLEHGKSITDEVMRELGRRPVTIIILSPAAMKSVWVKEEVDAAQNLRRFDPLRIIIPVTAQALTRSDFDGLWLPFLGAKRIEGHDMHPMNQDEAIKNILWALELEQRPNQQEKSAFELRAEDLISRARAYLAQSNYSETLKLVNEATASDSRLFDGWYIKGEAHLGLSNNHDLGNMSLAYASFRHSVIVAGEEKSQKEMLPIGYYGVGKALMKLVYYGRARKAFKKASQLAPAYSAAWVGLGEARAKLGFRHRAITAFNTAITKDPYASIAYYNKATTLEELHRHRSALDALDDAIALDIGNADAWRQKADLLTKLIPMGKKEEYPRFDEADDVYRALLAMAPDNPSHLKQYAALHMKRLGKEPNEKIALETYLRASKQAPDD